MHPPRRAAPRRRQPQTGLDLHWKEQEQKSRTAPERYGSLLYVVARWVRVVLTTSRVSDCSEHSTHARTHALTYLLVQTRTRAVRERRVRKTADTAPAELLGVTVNFFVCMYIPRDHGINAHGEDKWRRQNGLNHFESAPPPSIHHPVGRLRAAKWLSTLST